MAKILTRENVLGTILGGLVLAIAWGTVSDAKEESAREKHLFKLPDDSAVHQARLDSIKGTTCSIKKAHSDEDADKYQAASLGECFQKAFMQFEAFNPQKQTIEYSFHRDIPNHASGQHMGRGECSFDRRTNVSTCVTRTDKDRFTLIL